MTERSPRTTERAHPIRGLVLFTISAVLLAGASACQPEASPRAETGVEELDGDTVETPPLPEWTVDSVVRGPDPQSRRPVLVTDLRTGVHDRYERMTVEFEGSSGLPVVRASYVTPPVRACGSGRPVEPVGDSWLEVDLDPAVAHTEAGESTLPGREIPTDGDGLLRVYRTCDYEGSVTLVLALSDRRPYRVLTFDDPPRIAVDVQR